ncbi:MAG: Dihydrolipoyllysine-residue acetyltransferase component of pyruvate dehydrogenase complex [Planctomycetota bacterium]
MANDIRIPHLGWSMEEGTFVRWLKAPGDRVKPSEPLFELEGEKSVEPVESIDGGVLHVPAGAPGEGAVVKVGTLIGWLLADGEAAPAYAPEATPLPAAAPAAAPSHPAPAAAAAAPASLAPPAPRPTGPVGGPTSPAIRRLARELGVDVATVGGSGPAGRIMADDVFQVAVASVGSATGSAPGGRRPSTPRARATASRLGVDWALLRGSGRGGRVREADILGAAARPAAAASSSKPPSRLAGLPKRRRTIAERMLASQAENAPVTLHTRADVTVLAALRSRLKFSGTLPVPAYTDLLAKICADVLLRHPSLAGCWDLSGALVYPDADSLHIGIAVDTEGGLLVPVVRDVGRRSLTEITAESRALIEKARTQKLPAAAMEGGVFTITNLGGLWIDEFTPVINGPQTAILGVGAIRREPVVVADSSGAESIAIRDLMTLSLTFDHCRVDGGPAARFLDDLRRAIESPEGLA